MIIVTIDLVSANTGQKETLGIMHICNDGTAYDARKSNHDVSIANKRHAQTHDHQAIYDKPQRRARVENYNAPGYNVWRLVTRALRAAFKEEDGPSKSPPRPVKGKRMMPGIKDV